MAIDIEMNFIDFLISKKIDSEKFKMEENNLYLQWEQLFNLVNPESFVAQKKFLINPIRRRFLLIEK
jgi:hypothetical protein